MIAAKYMRVELLQRLPIRVECQIIDRSPGIAISIKREKERIQSIQCAINTLARQNKSVQHNFFPA